LAVACGGAEPTAVAGGKDYLRSAASLIGQLQQSPTANSETFTSPPVVGWQEGEGNVVNQKSIADNNFAPFRQFPATPYNNGSANGKQNAEIFRGSESARKDT
jgi:hypothetical protein